jgi:hypothetical protein
MLGNKAGNRRRGPDTLKRAINIFAGISWVLILLVFIFNLNSKPGGDSLYSKRYNVISGASTSLLIYANIVLVLVMIVCFIGFMINMNRHKRKSDRFSKSLIFFGIGSLIWLIYNLLSN